MTPSEFAAKWRGVTTGERASAQSHFGDLCRMLGEPTPTDADPTGSIYTVDRDSRALQVQVRALHDAFPNVSVTPLVSDFTMPLELPPLDGIVMANSLHFERDKLAVLRLVGGYLRPDGRLVLVEYDTDHGTPWVPFPLSFRSWATLAAEAGFRETRRLASIPSRFLGSIYSALSVR